MGWLPVYGKVTTQGGDSNVQDDTIGFCQVRGVFPPGHPQIAEERPFRTTYYLAALSGDPTKPFFAQQWQLSLSMMWTDRAAERIWVLREARRTGDGMELADVARFAKVVLAEGPEVAVIVAPQIADSVRDLLPAHLRARLVTWESP